MTNEKDRALALSIPLGVSCVCDIAHAGSICDKHQRIAAALATVRKEEREAAFQDALNVVLKTDWNASRSNIIEALEAAALTEK